MMYFYKHHFVNVYSALLFLGLYLNFKNVFFFKYYNRYYIRIYLYADSCFLVGY